MVNESVNFSSSLLACTRSAERDSVLVQTNGPISNDFTSVEYSDCIVLYMQSTRYTQLE